MTIKRTQQVPSVLSIAGFDGSGGAGIQADTKTISALGCYATNVLTALPIQNTQGVRQIYDIPTQAVHDQLAAIFDDIYPDSIKIGMVHSVDLVYTIANFLRDYSGPIIFDPVMVSTSGHRLIQEETIQACIEQLFPLASLITPNLDEVAVLVNREVKNLDQMDRAGRDIRARGSKAVLVKGGHLVSDTLTTLLIQERVETKSYSFPRIDTQNTHGSGCTLSSAIASYLARGAELEAAVKAGLDYVYQAIYHSRNLAIGQGNGPLNHFYEPQKLIHHELDR